MAKHNETGKLGESIASQYLTSKKYRILASNWCYKKFELDIIAQKENTLFVVEVKTRNQNYLGEPEEWVTKQKQEHLIKGANAYVLYHNLDVEVQFDIISVIIKGDKHQIVHFEDAFYARL
jgi:putative endonuclease